MDLACKIDAGEFVSAVSMGSSISMTLLWLYVGVFKERRHVATIMQITLQEQWSCIVYTFRRGERVLRKSMLCMLVKLATLGLTPYYGVASKVCTL